MSQKVRYRQYTNVIFNTHSMIPLNDEVKK